MRPHARVPAPSPTAIRRVPGGAGGIAPPVMDRRRPRSPSHCSSPGFSAFRLSPGPEVNPRRPRCVTRTWSQTHPSWGHKIPLLAMPAQGLPTSLTLSPQPLIPCRQHAFSRFQNDNREYGQVVDALTNSRPVLARCTPVASQGFNQLLHHEPCHRLHHLALPMGCFRPLTLPMITDGGRRGSRLQGNLKD